MLATLLAENAKLRKCVNIQTKPILQDCTNSKCEEDDDIYKLECKLCQRLVHYRCTRLPLYQLNHYTIKGFRKFICENCTQIQTHLKEICNESTVEESSPGLEQKISDLQKDRSSLSSELSHLQTLLEEQKDQCKKLEASRKDLVDKVKSLEKEAQQNIEQFKVKSIEIQPTIETLEREKISNDTCSIFEKVIEDKLEKIQKRIDETIADKFNNICSSIQEKIGEASNKMETIPKKVNESFKEVLQKNNARPLGTTPKIQDVMSQERNRQLVQESERKRRAMNIIIHGVKEESEAEVQHDKKYVEDLLDILGVDCKPDSTTRLGKKEDSTKSRPLKVKFKSEDVKDRVMSRLPNLKCADDRFRKISITDDYTIEERQEIRKFVDEAKSKNNNEKGNFYWRVHGSPKSGLSLKRVSKKMK